MILSYLCFVCLFSFFQGNHGQEQIQKKRVKKTVQVANRAVAGMSLEAILAKRNQTADFRKQQREQAAKAAKDANRAARAAKQAANKVCCFHKFFFSFAPAQN